MAKIDPLIDMLLREPGAELVLETVTAAMLRTASGARPVIRQTLTTAQILAACGEVANDDMRDEMPWRMCEFRYSAPGGAVRLKTEPSGDRIKVTLRADVIAMAPPPPAAAPRAAAVASTSSTSPGVPPHVAAESKKTFSARPAPSDASAAMSQLLELMVVHGASDLHLQSEAPPCLRVDGDIHPLEGFGTLTSGRLGEMLWAITPDEHREKWSKTHDADFAHETAAARFRVNLFQDRMGIGAVLRQIPTTIKSAEELSLSDGITNLCNLHKGLVLVTGPTGSGKSTTLAALIDRINRTRDDHIITIEDPIEFVHKNRRCIVNQREVGNHTASFRAALRAALREDPDVLLVGEMRDLETIEMALETAATGHLVFGTLHTNTAPQTVDRIIDIFPADRQPQVRAMLAESLMGVVAQVLCKRVGGGRAAAQEVLLATSAISNLIREGKTFQIASVMQTSKAAGMTTMNDALLDLVRKREVAPKDALAKAVARTELRAAIERAGFSIES